MGQYKGELLLLPMVSLNVYCVRGFIFFFFFLGDVEEKRASCSDVRDAYYCFLESVYENACDLNASQMQLKCASTCGFC